MRIILDASVAIPFIREENESVSAGRWIRRWTGLGGSFVVPRLFWWEVANPLIRRWAATAAEALEAIHQLEALSIETLDPDRGTLLLALSHAERYRLSMYDATYLAVAEQLDLPVATLDRELVAAAGPRAVDIHEPPSTRLSEERGPYGSATRSTWPDYSGAAAFLAKLRADEERAATR